MEQALIAFAISAWDRFDTGKAAIKALDELAADKANGAEEESSGDVSASPELKR